MTPEAGMGDGVFDFKSFMTISEHKEKQEHDILPPSFVDFILSSDIS